MALDSIFRDYSAKESQRSDRAAGDRGRHRQKIRDSIRENISDIIADEAIIGKSGDKIIKVPVRGIKEYKFVFGENEADVGAGDGNTQPGQVVGKIGKKPGAGEGGAGDQPGVDIYETDVTLDELTDLLFEDLGLPEMEKKALRQLVSERLAKREGYRRAGKRNKLDKKQSVIQKIKRQNASRINQEEEPPEEKDELGQLITPRFPFHRSDLRYRHFEFKEKPESNAVIFCLMDTSGSMDTLKKYLARSFFFLLYMFIRSKYQKAEVIFIAHTTEAKEVTEDDFFHKAESGGTYLSSAYKRTLEVIAERYHPSLWNIYAVHCSDGDNFDADNPEAIKLAIELTNLINLFGYAEIKPMGSRYYEGSMLKQFQDNIKAPNYAGFLVETKDDIWPRFKEMLTKDKVMQ